MSDLPEWMQRLQSQASRTAASSGTPGPYRPGYRPGAELPAYRAPRARPQGGSYAQERQFRMEGARDRFLRGGDLGAAGELALDMTGLPALAQAGRAFRAGDAQSGVTEGATGALQLAGTLSPLPNRGLFGRRLGGASMRNMTPPAEAAPQPQAMPRLLGRARDGSVLPMREPQPFRRTEARSEDLAAAAARPGQISAPAQQFDDGAMRALRRALREDGLEIPNPLPEFPRRRLGLGDLQRNQIGGLDRADAARYARMSGTAPPIMVRNLGRGRYYVLDGNRRALAAELRGDREIDAVDVSGVFDPSPAIPMVGGTPEARQRAIEQGFDVNTPLYHGTDRSFPAFSLDETGSRLPSDFGEGVYLTPSPERASTYANGLGMGRAWLGPDEGANVIPSYARVRNPLRVDDPNYQTNPSIAEQARSNGHDGLHVYGPDGLEEVVVFDPRNIRSRFAAFDPARSNSSDLLASWGGLAALPAGAEVARRRAQQK